MRTIILIWISVWVTGACSLSFAQIKRGKLDIFCPAPFVAKGHRSEQEVADAVQSKLLYFAKCYKTYFPRGASQAFKVRFRFSILPSGVVDDVKVVHQGIENKAFLECLQATLERIQFGRSETMGDCVVEQSIIFKVL